MKAGNTADAAAAEYKVPDKYKGFAAGTRVKANVELIDSELSKR